MFIFLFSSIFLYSFFRCCFDAKFYQVFRRMRRTGFIGKSESILPVKCEWQQCRFCLPHRLKRCQGLYKPFFKKHFIACPIVINLLSSDQHKLIFYHHPRLCKQMDHPVYPFKCQALILLTVNSWPIQRGIYISVFYLD